MSKYTEFIERLKRMYADDEVLSAYKSSVEAIRSNKEMKKTEFEEINSSDYSKLVVSNSSITIERRNFFKGLFCQYRDPLFIIQKMNNKMTQAELEGKLVKAMYDQMKTLFPKEILARATSVFESKVSANEKLSQFFNIAEHDVEKNVFESWKEKAYMDLFENEFYKDFKNPSAIEKFLAENNKELNLDLDKAVPELINYKPDSALFSDSSTHESEIDRLLDEYDVTEENNEIRNALMDAGNILQAANQNELELQSKIAEDMGHSADAKRIQAIRNHIVEEYPNEASFFAQSKIHVDVKNGHVRDTAFKFLRSEENVNVPDETVNTLIDIINQMEAAGINGGGLVFEKPTKEYSMLALVNAKKAVAEAIKENNKEKIIDSVNKYHELEGKYDDIIAQLKNINPDQSVTANISSSRVAQVPAKYRIDYLGTSRLTGLWMVKGFSDRYGIDLRELLTNPVEAITKKANQLVREGAFEAQLKEQMQSGNYLEAINMLSNPEALISESKSFNRFIHGFERVAESIANLVPDQNIREKLQMQNMIAYGTVGTCAHKFCIDIATQIESNPSQAIVNILAREADDFTIRGMMDISEDTFELDTLEPVYKSNKDYMQAHKNYESVIIRASQAIVMAFSLPDDNQNKRNIYNGVQNLIHDIDELVPNKSEVFVSAINEINEAHQLKNTMIINLKAEQEFNKYMNPELSQDDDVVNGIKALADLKAKYSDRSLFAKIFYSNVRMQSRLIDSMTTRLTANGLSERQIKNYVNAINSGNEELKQRAISSLTDRFAPVQVANNEPEVQVNPVEQIEIPEHELNNSAPQNANDRVNDEPARSNEVDLNNSK